MAEPSVLARLQGSPGRPRVLNTGMQTVAAFRKGFDRGLSYWMRIMQEKPKAA